MQYQRVREYNILRHWKSETYVLTSWLNGVWTLAEKEINHFLQSVIQHQQLISENGCHYQVAVPTSRVWFDVSPRAHYLYQVYSEFSTIRICMSVFWKALFFIGTTWHLWYPLAPAPSKPEISPIYKFDQNCPASNSNAVWFVVGCALMNLRRWQSGVHTSGLLNWIKRICIDNAQ